MSKQGELFDLAEGVARKEAGLDQVEETDARGLRWIDRARTEACRVAAANPARTATSDDIRRWAAATDDHPHHPNAWGSIFRGKNWVNAGLTRSKLATNHGRRIFVWRLA